MNDPRDRSSTNGSVPSPGDSVDEWASRLLDGDIVATDVPPALRGDVARRMETFSRQRHALAEIDGLASDTALERAVDRGLAAHRRQQFVRRPRAFGVAAAAASVLVLAGLGLTRVGSDEPVDLADGEAAVMSAADASTPMAYSDAPKMEQATTVAEPSLALTPDESIVAFESEEELRTLSETWSFDALTRESSQQTEAVPCLSEPMIRLVTRNALFRGQPVEVYLADSGDIIVYALSDCSVLLRLGA